MPRQVRQQSKSGIYHLIFRGTNKQIIFEEDDDRERFMWCLKYYKETFQYEIYGYCLMNNHIHLLIKEGKEPISATVKRLGVSYVGWFNRKYGRCGHLFQDRYKSEPVETDEYFLEVLRYIHQNPLKLAYKIDTYKWSSYQEYLRESKITDKELALGIFSSDPKKANSQYKRYMSEKAEEISKIGKETIRLTDQEVKEAIQKTTNLPYPSALQHMQVEKRNALLREIKNIDGVSTRQIARLTGISQSVIARA